jgi:voltage-gated potassium channel
MFSKFPKLTKKQKKIISDVIAHTPVLKVTYLLIVLWLLFAAALYISETGSSETAINSYGKALYWGIAAFSTAGIADAPKTGLGEFIGAVWIIVGSMLFFGAIVSTITSYFLRTMQRPAKKIVETIEYNLEQLEELSVEELELLKKTTDTLIMHMEQVQKKKERIEKQRKEKEQSKKG